MGRLGSLPDIDIVVADSLGASGTTITVGDVVLLEGCAGKVVACCQQEGVLLALVERYVFVAAVTPHSGRWKSGGPLEAWPADAILASPAWHVAGDVIVVLKLP